MDRHVASTFIFMGMVLSSCTVQAMMRAGGGFYPPATDFQEGTAGTAYMDDEALKQQAIADRAAKIAKHWRQVAQNSAERRKLEAQEKTIETLSAEMQEGKAKATPDIKPAKPVAKKPLSPLRVSAKKLTLALCYLIGAAALWKLCGKSYDIASGACLSEPLAPTMCENLSGSGQFVAGAMSGLAAIGAVNGAVAALGFGQEALIGAADAVGDTVSGSLGGILG